ncbi:MAG TPA: hypothetical protein VGX28_14590 [Frankiaceae bacterium]|nr:hypothetical protein [Frankiaceae bacterium]
MSPSDAPPPRFFVDRSLGAVVVPRLLREVGVDLQTMRERYGEDRAQDVPDVEWLADVGEEGLVVLMKDKRIRTRPAEHAAVRRFAVRCFCVSTGNLTGPDMAALFVASYDRMVALCETPGPFIYQVSSRALRRVL